MGLWSAFRHTFFSIFSRLHPSTFVFLAKPILLSSLPTSFSALCRLWHCVFDHPCHPFRRSMMMTNKHAKKCVCVHIPCIFLPPNWWWWWLKGQQQHGTKSNQMDSMPLNTSAFFVWRRRRRQTTWLNEWIAAATMNKMLGKYFFRPFFLRTTATTVVVVVANGLPSIQCKQ